MTFGRREELIARADFRQCFSLRRIPLYVTLAGAGVFLIVQRGDLPPLIVVCATAVCALERQFNAIFSRTRGELPALTLLPVEWEGVIAAKNLATAFALPAMTVALGSVMLYFSPRPADLAGALDALEYVWSLFFTLLIIGNLRSSQDPRPVPGEIRNAFIQAGGMILVLTVCSLPYIVFHVLGGNSAGAILTGIAGAVYWVRRSVPATARRALTYFQQS